MIDPDRYVLVVDDEPDIAESIQLILELDGYAVETAANGAEALAAIDRGRPALILLDMLMPIMNGWQFAAELADRSARRPPIVVITAAEDARARADEIGADDHLKKPFDVAALRAKVREHVARDPAQTAPEAPAALEPLSRAHR